MIKIKVIDLLNKIANGEEITHFKFGRCNFVYDENVRNWINGEGDILSTYCNVEKCLNEEVEIIEKDEKIEHLDIYNCFHIMGDNEVSRLRLDDNFQNISDKINEIIDYINKGE